MTLAPGSGNRASSPAYPLPDEIYAANHDGLTREQQTLQWFRQHVTPSLCDPSKYTTSSNGLQSITVGIHSLSMPTLELDKVARREIATHMPGFFIAQLSITPASSVYTFRLRLVERFDATA